MIQFILFLTKEISTFSIKSNINNNNKIFKLQNFNAILAFIMTHMLFDKQFVTLHVLYITK